MAAAIDAITIAIAIAIACHSFTIALLSLSFLYVRLPARALVHHSATNPFDTLTGLLGSKTIDVHNLNEYKAIPTTYLTIGVV